MSTTNSNKHDEWIVRTFTNDSQQPQASPNTRDTNKETNNKIPTRLVLHLDINETILLGDDAGGDSTSDSIQKMLAKSAFCQVPSDKKSLDWDSTQQIEPTHWWDGQKIGEETSIPPLYTGWEWPPNTCSYYRTKFKKYSKEFVAQSTEEDDDPTTVKKKTGQPHHGAIYKPVWMECQRLLSTVDTSSSAQNSMKRHPHLLPAFYHILDYLQGLQQSATSNASTTTPPVTLVFRTFGSDIQEVADWVTEYAKENDCPWLEIRPNQLYQGRWKELEEQDGSGNLCVIYQLWDLEETHVIAKDEDEILKLLNSGTIFGIRDDYNYWKQHQWLPTAGKPVWIPSTPLSPQSSSDDKEPVFCHHLLFDDNIHNLPDDGIACIRQQESSTGSKFTTVEASVMHGGEYQGIHLKRVPTVEPVLNPNWYIEQIEHSRVLLQEKLLQQVAKDRTI